MADAFLDSLFRHKAWCNERLVEALRAVPDDVDPAQLAVVLFTFGHTAIVDQIFKAHLSGAGHDLHSVVPTQRPHLEALAAKMRETDAWYIDYAVRVSPAELDEVVEFTFVDGDHGRMTKGEILAHIITHGASHRGAIGKMLEGMRVKGAPDMVTTFQRETAGGG